MKKFEKIKEYSNNLLGIATNIKLLGMEFPNSRLVKKILLMILERFETSRETSNASLENTKDLSTITLTKVIRALQHKRTRD